MKQVSSPQYCLQHKSKHQVLNYKVKMIKKIYIQYIYTGNVTILHFTRHVFEHIVYTCETQLTTYNRRVPAGKM